MTSLELRRERGDLIHMYRIMTGKDDVKFKNNLDDFKARDVIFQ